MKRLVAITALITGLWCGTASAQNVAPNVNPQSIGPVKVSLNDGASDACWTNLREVREYVEEKLRMSGYYVADTPRAPIYSFSITVHAYRSNNQCVGRVSAELMKFAFVDEIFGDFVVGSNHYVGNRSSNLNNLVITAVQELIDEM